ncbi:hypothetical protein ElyMa_003017600 [Elysia marginata]|uniref:RIIa domain-containing protein n=1 Tax=Elysia marginata TaxID=1093978 RepID=A0AAV4IIR9_9GAST|nr:hypothetical protein ElyMa_003017600 [Elysia marginata]
MDTEGEQSAYCSLDQLVSCHEDIGLNPTSSLSQLTEAPTRSPAAHELVDQESTGKQQDAPNLEQPNQCHLQQQLQFSHVKQEKQTKTGKKRAPKHSRLNVDETTSSFKKKHSHSRQAPSQQTAKSESKQLTPAQRAYWQTQLPLGFDYYLSRIAGAVIGSQPDNIFVFCSEFLDDLYRERISELARLPSRSYLDKLHQRKFGVSGVRRARSFDNLSDFSITAEEDQGLDQGLECGLATDLDPPTIHSGDGGSDVRGSDVTSSHGATDEHASSQQTWFTAEQTASDQQASDETGRGGNSLQGRGGEPHSASPTIVNRTMSRDNSLALPEPERGMSSESCSSGSSSAAEEEPEVHTDPGNSLEDSKLDLSLVQGEAEIDVSSGMKCKEKDFSLVGDGHLDTHLQDGNDESGRTNVTCTKQSIGIKQSEGASVAQTESTNKMTLGVSCKAADSIVKNNPTIEKSTGKGAFEVLDVQKGGMEYQISLGTIDGVPFHIALTSKTTNALGTTSAEQHAVTSNSAEQNLKSGQCKEDMENEDYKTKQGRKKSKGVDETTTGVTGAGSPGEKQPTSRDVKNELVTPKSRSVRDIIEQFRMSESKWHNVDHQRKQSKLPDTSKYTAVGPTNNLKTSNDTQKYSTYEMAKQSVNTKTQNTIFSKRFSVQRKLLKGEFENSPRDPESRAGLDLDKHKIPTTSATPAVTVVDQGSSAGLDGSLSQTRIARAALLLWWSKSVGKCKTTSCRMKFSGNEICGRKGEAVEKDSYHSQKETAGRIEEDRALNQRVEFIERMRNRGAVNNEKEERTFSRVNKKGALNQEVKGAIENRIKKEVSIRQMKREEVVNQTEKRGGVSHIKNEGTVNSTERQGVTNQLEKEESRTEVEKEKSRTTEGTETFKSKREALEKAFKDKVRANLGSTKLPTKSQNEQGLPNGLGERAKHRREEDEPQVPAVGTESQHQRGGKTDHSRGRWNVTNVQPSYRADMKEESSLLPQGNKDDGHYKCYNTFASSGSSNLGECKSNTLGVLNSTEEAQSTVFLTSAKNPRSGKASNAEAISPGVKQNMLWVNQSNTPPKTKLPFLSDLMRSKLVLSTKDSETFETDTTVPADDLRGGLKSQPGHPPPTKLDRQMQPQCQIGEVPHYGTATVKETESKLQKAFTVSQNESQKVSAEDTLNSRFTGMSDFSETIRVTNLNTRTDEVISQEDQGPSVSETQTPGMITVHVSSQLEQHEAEPQLETAIASDEVADTEDGLLYSCPASVSKFPHTNITQMPIQSDGKRDLDLIKFAATPGPNCSNDSAPIVSLGNTNQVESEKEGQYYAIGNNEDKNDGSLEKEDYALKSASLKRDRNSQHELETISDESCAQLENGEEGETDAEKALFLASLFVEGLERVAGEIESVYHQRKVVGSSADSEGIEQGSFAHEQQQSQSLAPISCVGKESRRKQSLAEHKDTGGVYGCEHSDAEELDAGVESSASQLPTSGHVVCDDAHQHSNPDPMISIPGLFSFPKSLLEDIARAILAVSHTSKDKGKSAPPQACYRFVGEGVVFKIQPASVSLGEQTSEMPGEAGTSSVNVGVPESECVVNQRLASVGDGSATNQEDSASLRPERSTNQARRNAALRRALSEKSEDGKAVISISVDTSSVEQDLFATNHCMSNNNTNLLDAGSNNFDMKQKSETDSDNFKSGFLHTNDSFCNLLSVVKEVNKNSNNKMRCGIIGVKENGQPRRKKSSLKLQSGSSCHVKSANRYHSKCSYSKVNAYRTGDCSNNSSTSGDQNVGEHNLSAKGAGYNRRLVEELKSLTTSSDAGLAPTPGPPTSSGGSETTEPAIILQKSQHNTRPLEMCVSPGVHTISPVCCSNGLGLDTRNESHAVQSNPGRDKSLQRQPPPTRWIFKSGGMLGISGRSQTWFGQEAELESKENCQALSEATDLQPVLEKSRIVPSNKNNSFFPSTESSMKNPEFQKPLKDLSVKIPDLSSLVKEKFQAKHPRSLRDLENCEWSLGEQTSPTLARKISDRSLVAGKKSPLSFPTTDTEETRQKRYLTKTEPNTFYPDRQGKLSSPTRSNFSGSRCSTPSPFKCESRQWERPEMQYTIIENRYYATDTLSQEDEQPLSLAIGTPDRNKPKKREINQQSGDLATRKDKTQTGCRREQRLVSPRAATKKNKTATHILHHSPKSMKVVGGSFRAGQDRDGLSGNLTGDDSVKSEVGAKDEWVEFLTGPIESNAVSAFLPAPSAESRGGDEGDGKTTTPDISLTPEFSRLDSESPRPSLHSRDGKLVTTDRETKSHYCGETETTSDTTSVTTSQSTSNISDTTSSSATSDTTNNTTSDTTSSTATSDTTSSTTTSDTTSSSATSDTTSNTITSGTTSNTTIAISDESQSRTLGSISSNETVTKSGSKLTITREKSLQDGTVVRTDEAGTYQYYTKNGIVIRSPDHFYCNSESSILYSPQKTKEIHGGAPDSTETETARLNNGINKQSGCSMVIPRKTFSSASQGDKKVSLNASSGFHRGLTSWFLHKAENLYGEILAFSDDGENQDLYKTKAHSENVEDEIKDSSKRASSHEYDTRGHLEGQMLSNQTSDKKRQAPFEKNVKLQEECDKTMGCAGDKGTGTNAQAAGLSQGKERGMLKEEDQSDVDDLVTPSISQSPEYHPKVEPPQSSLRKVTKKRKIRRGKSRLTVSRTTRRSPVRETSPQFAWEVKGLAGNTGPNQRRWSLKGPAAKVNKQSPQEISKPSREVSKSPVEVSASPREILKSPQENFISKSQISPVSSSSNSGSSRFSWKSLVWWGSGKQAQSEISGKPEELSADAAGGGGRVIEFPLSVRRVAEEEVEDSEEVTRVLTIEEPQKNVYVNTTFERRKPRRVSTVSSGLGRCEPRCIALRCQLMLLVQF